MDSLKYHPLSAHQPPHRVVDSVRWLVAASLRKASMALAALAWKLVHVAPRQSDASAHLEFYAEAGAAEGALYLDGKLVGWIEGVRRL